jgi:dienelactone hydrolase
MRTSPRVRRFSLVCCLALASTSFGQQAEWLERFSYQPPASGHSRLAEHRGIELPELEVEPAATGWQMVRVSLPLLAGSLPEGVGLQAIPLSSAVGESLPVDVRIVSWHPGWPRYARRALISFPWCFSDRSPVRFGLRPAVRAEAELVSPAENFGMQTLDPEQLWQMGPLQVRLGLGGIELQWKPGQVWRAELLAPEATLDQQHVSTSRLEVIEHSQHHLWLRLLSYDSEWPRIVELRANSLGQIVLIGQLQRNAAGDDYAPQLGWRIWSPQPPSELAAYPLSDRREALEIAVGDVWARFPRAHWQRTGEVRIDPQGLLHWSCRAEDRVPMQSQAWRQVSLVLGPERLPDFNAMHEVDHRYRIEPRFYDSLYGCGLEVDLSAWPQLEQLRKAHRDFVASASARGLDMGNVTAAQLSGEAAVNGMNRLNHCRPIFDDAYRSGRSELRSTALLWCENTHDLTIWWGEDAFMGGLRYPNAQYAGEADPPEDDRFMWRANSGRHTFCTKGYASFLYAWEETGDPRMATALRHQVAYAQQHVRADGGEARNIGDVDDFVRLYRMTGQPQLLEDAVRLWRQLADRLGPDGLFSQSGDPISGQRPFIDRDQDAGQVPYAKAYILGYALTGCPALLEWLPADEQLLRMLRGVADFMAAAIDPAGGWRYPAPESSQLLLGQAMEHAAQLVCARQALIRAGKPADHLLDAIELVLQARLNGWLRSGAVLSGVAGWERSTGLIGAADSLTDRYALPQDRPRDQDYDLGSIGLDAGPPDALVYLPEVLAHYLMHRPAERLLNRTPQLERLLNRLPEPSAAPVPAPAPQPVRYAIVDGLPTFNSERLAEMVFPGRWSSQGHETDAGGRVSDRQIARYLVGSPAAAQAGLRELTHESADLTASFRRWRVDGRQALIDSLGQPPPRVAFEPTILGSEDRGSYTAHRVSFNLSRWQRVLGYLLVPKGDGPFPAALALHDHGAHFSIGKEKVIRPFDEQPERLEDARKWVETYYGGVWIGDALAERGWVVFATDALLWGDRGSRGGSKFEDQQMLAANLLQIGMSWAGIMLWDDLRSAEFLQSRAEVDPERIAAIGLSVGAYRTWNLAAASDIIRAGAAICWMGDTLGLATPGNNQTRGQSAFSMLQPLIRNRLDYADVASLSAPKPMLFYNGSHDPLFPVDAVERAYRELRRVWSDQSAAHRLETKLWPVPHRFELEMQAAAFEFLERQLAE